MADRDLKTENMGTFSISHIARPHAMQGERLSSKHCGQMGHEEATCFELVGYHMGGLLAEEEAAREKTEVDEEVADAAQGVDAVVRQRMQPDSRKTRSSCRRESLHHQNRIYS